MEDPETKLSCLPSLSNDKVLCFQKTFLIQAFDDPYPGASTFLDNKRIFLKKCQISNEKTNFHPFQAGIIIRKYNKNILVAANGKGLIIHQILNENGKDIFSQIKLGHRFHTPTAILEDAKTYRAK